MGLVPTGVPPGMPPTGELPTVAFDLLANTTAMALARRSQRKAVILTLWCLCPGWRVAFVRPLYCGWLFCPWSRIASCLPEREAAE